MLALSLCLPGLHPRLASAITPAAARRVRDAGRIALHSDQRLELRQAGPVGCGVAGRDGFPGCSVSVSPKGLDHPLRPGDPEVGRRLIGRRAKLLLMLLTSAGCAPL